MDDLIVVYAEWLRAAGRSPYTVSTRCRVLRHARRTLPRGLDKANGDDIRTYLARLTEPWSLSTQYSHLHMYYSTMVNAGRLAHDPTTTIPRPPAGDRIPNPVTDDELYLAVDRSPDQPWRRAVILASYAGLRCGELCHLLREDVTERHVHVRRGKGGRGRYVPTHRHVWDLVRELPAGPVLRRPNGHGYKPETLTSSQHQHWAAIGLPEIHMHRFRHWFGTTLVDQGVGIEVVQELMGHAMIETTRGYVRVSVARHQAAMLALPALRMGTPAGL